MASAAAAAAAAAAAIVDWDKVGDDDEPPPGMLVISPALAPAADAISADADELWATGEMAAAGGIIMLPF